MLLAVGRMNYTRKKVLRGVRELSKKGKRVTYEELAQYADCSYTTVRRAVVELEKEGVITKVSKGKGFGFRYEVKR